MVQDRSWHGGRPQPKRLYVRWGPSPLPNKGAKPPPKFLAHIYCGQTAGWIKMTLGIEVDISPGDFVLDVDPASLSKGVGAPFPIFGPFLLRPNGWIHQDATWYGGRPHPRWLCVRWGPSPLPKKARPNFCPCVLRPNGCMDQDATWYGCKPQLQGRNHWAVGVEGGGQDPKIWTDHPNFFDEE